MEHLLRDLLDTTGMQVGRFTMEQQREEASTVIREVVDAHREFAKRKSIELLHECELQGTFICCDRERLLQAFGNLLGNAIKFCRAGDVVMVRGVSDGPSAKFSITDTGLGIPPNELPHIFEPYWSAKRHARKGTGLGLYIAKGIVEGHRGTLSVDSKLGEGTTFTISLPFADPKASC
jgi:signal transduction histidine kinase